MYLEWTDIFGPLCDVSYCFSHVLYCYWNLDCQAKETVFSNGQSWSSRNLLTLVAAFRLILMRKKNVGQSRLPCKRWYEIKAEDTVTSWLIVFYPGAEWRGKRELRTKVVRLASYYSGILLKYYWPRIADSDWTQLCWFRGWFLCDTLIPTQEEREPSKSTEYICPKWNQSQRTHL